MWGLLLQALLALVLFVYGWVNPGKIEPTYQEMMIHRTHEQNTFLTQDLLNFKASKKEQHAIALARRWLDIKNPVTLSSAVSLLESFLSDKSSYELRLVLGSLYAEMRRCDLTLGVLQSFHSSCAGVFCPEDDHRLAVTLKQICTDVLAHKGSLTTADEWKIFSRYVHTVPSEMSGISKKE